jgi:hypothetical protein
MGRTFAANDGRDRMMRGSADAGTLHNRDLHDLLLNHLA